MQPDPDALISASNAAARWPKGKMGIQRVPGCTEPIDAARQHLGMRPPRFNGRDPVRGWLVWGYRRKFGNYNMDLYARPEVLAENLRRWAEELKAPHKDPVRMVAVEALYECIDILESPSLDRQEALQQAREIARQVFRERKP